MEIITRKEAKERGLKRYFTGKPCKHGHIAERNVCGGHCCACIAERNRKHRNKIAEYNRKRYKQNKDKNAEICRKYYEQNKDNLIEMNRKYREQNKDKIAEKSRKYYEQNKDKLTEKMRKWNKANPEQGFIRNTLNRILRNWKGGRAKAEDLLGYTCEQLRSHIESQFKEGMSWDNRSEWHIDHIKPIKAFLDEGITDPAIINALDNLQPLWASENLSKSAKWDGND
ncbi:coil containing protein [Vibrio phage 1.240.O._10N.261.52.F8]|nr:coil containing protein [Vibrio phage 1.240.O._10N.261.52.F8]